MFKDEFEEELNMKYLLLINFLLFFGFLHAEPENHETHEEVPVFVISKEQIDRMENLTVGQLLKIMGAKLPVPDENATYLDVTKLIKQSKNKIIEDTGELVIVESIGESLETDEKKVTFQTLYYFKEGLLVSGPVWVNSENIKEEKKEYGDLFMI